MSEISDFDLPPASVGVFADPPSLRGPFARARGISSPTFGDTSRQKFSAISMLDLELKTRATGDGAESSIFSDDGHCSNVKNKNGKERVKVNIPCENDPLSDSDDSDLEEVLGMAPSVTSSTALKTATKKLFPCKGITCVGCAAPMSIAKVTDFVGEQFLNMQETTLYKLAAFMYKTEIQDKAQFENVNVPDWGWKDIR